MATVIYPLDVRGADVGTANIPELFLTMGTGTIPYPATGYAFDAAATETIYFKLPYIPTYGSGNISMIIDWFAAATTGAVVWAAGLAAITVGTDTTSYLTKSIATLATATPTVVGTTNVPNRTTIAISSLDSIATADDVTFLLQRQGAAGGDTMAGDAFLVNAYLSYSDT